MRLPFDLLAALMALETTRMLMGQRYVMYSLNEQRLISETVAPSGQAWLALGAFLLVTWLLHEGLVRATEWRMRFGYHPAGVPRADGVPPRVHPFEFHARGTLVIQALMVIGYFGFLFVYEWPLKTMFWPEAIGLSGLSDNVRHALGHSQFFGCFTDLGPFLIAMILGWLPKRRLSARYARRRLSTWSWLAFEARLTCLPLILWVGLYLLEDLLALGLTREQGYWLQTHPTVGVLASFLLLGLFAVVLMPLMVIWLWQCKPMPDGPMRQRLEALMARSGVKARAILLWGPAQSGLANACVLGPWAPLRYILISPSLMEQLSDDECEAVVAHELGHARYGHLGLLFTLVLALAAVATLLQPWTESLGVVGQSIFYLLLITGYIRVVFGAISRACEREADLASAEMMDTPVPIISALEKIGVAAGNIREVYSWHHDSIAARVNGLAQTWGQPEGISALHDRLRRLRLVVTALAVLALAAVVVSSGDSGYNRTGPEDLERKGNEHGQFKEQAARTIQ